MGGKARRGAGAAGRSPPLPTGGLQLSGPAGPGTDRGKEHQGAVLHVPAMQAGHTFRGDITAWRRVPATCVLFPGIAGERFRDGCFTPSAYDHNGASRFPSVQYWYLCKANPAHLFPPRTETNQAVLYQRLMEVFKINSQSPSGNLFFHAEKI